MITLLLKTEQHQWKSARQLGLSAQPERIPPIYLNPPQKHESFSWEKQHLIHLKLMYCTNCIMMSVDVTPLEASVSLLLAFLKALNSFADLNLQSFSTLDWQKTLMVILTYHLLQCHRVRLTDSRAAVTHNIALFQLIRGSTALACNIIKGVHGQHLSLCCQHRASV